MGSGSLLVKEPGQVSICSNEPRDFDSEQCGSEADLPSPKVSQSPNSSQSNSQPSSLCPGCNRRSSRVHSRYRRTVADLPWEGLPVKILLESRKFFCGNGRCPRTSSRSRCLERWRAMRGEAAGPVKHSVGSRSRSVGERARGWPANWACLQAD